MIENPPDACLDFKQSEKEKEGSDGIMRRLQCPTNIDRDVRAFRSVNQHQVMEVVAGQEQRLAHNPLICFCKRCDAIWIP